jgi:hypothetical protein
MPEHIVGVDAYLDDQPNVDWRGAGDRLCHELQKYLDERGLVPAKTPELPPPSSVPLAEVRGRFRVLCQYTLFPVIGWDEDREEPIIGTPRYQVRVDTIVEAPDAG